MELWNRLRNAPENFMIGRDDYGWRYSMNANSGNMANWVTYFPTIDLAVIHAIENYPDEFSIAQSTTSSV